MSVHSSGPNLYKIFIRMNIFFKKYFKYLKIFKYLSHNSTNVLLKSRALRPSACYSGITISREVC